MDVQILTSILQVALTSPDPSGKAAEETLNEIQYEREHLTKLLEIIVDGNCDLSVRHIASICFKNFIVKNWKPDDHREQSIISRLDKSVVRRNILTSFVEVPQLLRAQLGVCLETMVNADYPDEWPDLLDWGKFNLHSKHYYGASFLLRLISKKYEFIQDRQLVNQFVNETFPNLFIIFHEILKLKNPSIQEADLIKLICKIFWSSINMEIPKKLLNPDIFELLMVNFLEVLKRPVPSEGQPSNPDQRKSWGWWKVKTWILQILNRLCYHIRGLDLDISDNLVFGHWFKDNFAWKISGQYVEFSFVTHSGGYLPDNMIIFILQFLTDGLRKISPYSPLDPIQKKYLFETIFVPMCFNDNDQKLWDEDPHDYVLKGYDFTDDLYPRTAAISLLYALIEKRGKENLTEFLKFIRKICVKYDKAATENKPYRKKDGALFAIGALCPDLKYNAAYKSNLEAMFVKHVLPEFQSTVGHLRAKAAWVAGMYADFNFADRSNFLKALYIVFAGMYDLDLPVRVGSFNAVCSFVKASEGLVEIRPLIPELLDESFKIMNEVENEDLVSVLVDTLDKFGEEIATYAIGLCPQIELKNAIILCQILAAAYWNCVNSEIDTANACSDAINKIIMSVTNLPKLFAHIEPIFLRNLTWHCLDEEALQASDPLRFENLMQSIDLNRGRNTGYASVNE